VNGEKDGVWREWYRGDQHLLEREEHYVNGKLDGEYRQ